MDELSIQTLIPCIQEYLINNQYEFLQQNPIEILETIYQINHHGNIFLKQFVKDQKYYSILIN